MPSNLQGTVRSVLSGLANDFALRLWQLTAPAFGTQNASISPVSTYILLLMIAVGADGQTKDELLNLLGLTGASESDLVTQFDKFRIDLFTVPDWMREGHFAEWWQGNALFCSPETQVSDNYREVCSRWFGAQVKQVNFRFPESVKVINAWACEMTNSHLHEIISDPPGDAACVLANAVYFFDLWDQPFKFDESQYRPFQLADGMQIRVDMMRRDGTQKHLENEHFEAVKLPYKDPRFCMYCFIPKPNAAVSQIINFLTQNGWWKQFSERNLELWLPRFNFPCAVRLRDTLMRAGVQNVFMPGANLGRIGPMFRIDEVLHETMIRVDEIGVQQDQTVSTTMRNIAPPGPKKLIAFDRPFVFVVRHEFAHTPVFIGTVARPQQ